MQRESRHFMRPNQFSKVLGGILLFIAVSTLSACGPTVRKAPELEGAKIQTLAVLPAKADPDLRRERVEFVRQSLIRELVSSGFVVLDDSIVNRICVDAECSARAKLKEKYKIDGLVAIELKSLSRVNLGAAYYNRINGDVKLLTADSKELLDIEHTESEKGGLLFNSGQVIQALIETYDNAGDDSFNKLAERFEKTVAYRYPSPTGGAVLTGLSDVNITQTEITPLGDSRYRICAKGNSGATANFVVDRIKTPLRERTPGEYCGAMLLGNLVQPTSKVGIELRSAFGVPVQTALEPTPFLACMPKNIVSRVAGPSTQGLRIGCADGLSAEDKNKCEAQLKSCATSQFLVYRSDTNAGPYARVGQVAQQAWSDSQGKKGSGAVYAVVAVSKNGGSSIPLTLIEKE